MAFKPKIKAKTEAKVKWYKNSKFLVYIIGIFIMLIMIASVLNIRGNKEEKQKYNGYTFTKADNGWITYVNNQAVAFSYLPSELEYITLPSMNLKLQKAYIMFNPDETNLQDYNMQKLAYSLRYFNVNAFFACAKESGCPDIPIEDCNSTNTIFYFKAGNETKAYKDSNCIVLEGDPIGQQKLVERINYALFGIIQ